MPSRLSRLGRVVPFPNATRTAHGTSFARSAHCDTVANRRLAVSGRSSEMYSCIISRIINMRVVLMGVLVCALSEPVMARPRHVGHTVPSTIRHFEPAERLTIQHEMVTSNGRSTEHVHMSFYTLGRLFDLELEPNHLFAPDHRTLWLSDGRADEDATEPFLYKGRLVNDPASWARIAIRNGAVEGMISTADEIY